MANLSMSYEVVMIFSVTLGEEGIAAITEKFKTLISENGTVSKIEEWGKRRLAYPINDEPEGYYMLVEFTSTPDFPTELNRVFNITDGVLRSLVVRKEDVSEKEKPAEQPQVAEAAQVPEAPAEAEAPVEAEAPAEAEASAAEQTVQE